MDLYSFPDRAPPRESQSDEVEAKEDASSIDNIESSPTRTSVRSATKQSPSGGVRSRARKKGAKTPPSTGSRRPRSRSRPRTPSSPRGSRGPNSPRSSRPTQDSIPRRGSASSALSSPGARPSTPPVQRPQSPRRSATPTRPSSRQRRQGGGGGATSSTSIAQHRSSKRSLPRSAAGNTSGLGPYSSSTSADSSTSSTGVHPPSAGRSGHGSASKSGRGVAPRHAGPSAQQRVDPPPLPKLAFGDGGQEGGGAVQPQKSSSPDAQPLSATVPAPQGSKPLQAMSSQSAASASGTEYSRVFDPDGGYVQVFIRCRPLFSFETPPTDQSMLKLHPTTNSVEYRGLTSHSGVHTFIYDRVFDPSSTQEDVYRSVGAPMVDLVFKGMKCCVICYGESATGKTHTMVGPAGVEEGQGIFPRAMAAILSVLGSAGPEHRVSIAALELYNEQLRDLLAPETSSRLRLVENAKGEVVCLNQSRVEVRSPGDVTDVLQAIGAHSATEPTKLNSASNRSHRIFTVKVSFMRPDVEDSEKLVKDEGTLMLVDLAGSESVGRSGVTERAAFEAGKINRSLLCLGRVINALGDDDPRIPYRDSKLTRLLSEPLGGRFTTALIGTVAPGSEHAEETHNTLKYARRAMESLNQTQLSRLRHLELAYERLKHDHEQLVTEHREAHENFELKTQQMQTKMSRLKRTCIARLQSFGAAMQQHQHDMIRTTAEASAHTQELSKQSQVEASALETDIAQPWADSQRAQLEAIGSLLGELRQHTDQGLKRLQETLEASATQTVEKLELFSKHFGERLLEEHDVLEGGVGRTEESIGNRAKQTTTQRTQRMGDVIKLLSANLDTVMTQFETNVTKTAQDREQAEKERHTLQHGLSQQLDGLRQGMSGHTDAMCDALDAHRSAATDTNRLQLQCIANLRHVLEERVNDVNHRADNALDVLKSEVEFSAMPSEAQTTAICEQLRTDTTVGSHLTRAVHKHSFRDKYMAPYKANRDYAVVPSIADDAVIQSAIAALGREKYVPKQPTARRSGSHSSASSNGETGGVWGESAASMKSPRAISAQELQALSGAAPSGSSTSNRTPAYKGTRDDAGIVTSLSGVYADSDDGSGSASSAARQQGGGGTSIHPTASPRRVARSASSASSSAESVASGESQMTEASGISEASSQLGSGTGSGTGSARSPRGKSAKRSSNGKTKTRKSRLSRVSSNMATAGRVADSQPVRKSKATTSSKLSSSVTASTSSSRARRRTATATTATGSGSASGRRGASATRPSTKSITSPRQGGGGGSSQDPPTGHRHRSASGRGGRSVPPSPKERIRTGGLPRTDSTTAQMDPTERQPLMARGKGGVSSKAGLRVNTAPKSAASGKDGGGSVSLASSVDQLEDGIDSILISPRIRYQSQSTSTSSPMNGGDSGNTSPRHATTSSPDPYLHTASDEPDSDPVSLHLMGDNDEEEEDGGEVEVYSEEEGGVDMPGDDELVMVAAHRSGSSASDGSDSVAF